MLIDDHFTTYNQPPFANSVHWDSLHSRVSPAAPAVESNADFHADILDRLEKLDDVIFAAIDGDADALDEAAATWQCTVEELGQETVEESRQQYLRFAKSVWESARDNSQDAESYPFAAIEIIGLLAESER